jgi:hypothetical protein
MLLKLGKEWLTGMLYYDSADGLYLPDAIDGIVFGSSGSAVAESDEWVKGSTAYDSGDPAFDSDWSVPPVFSLVNGLDHSPPYAADELVLTVTCTDYQPTQSEQIREVLLVSGRASRIAAGTPPAGYPPQAAVPWFPVSRFLVNDFTIGQGDDLTLTWILTMRSSIPDG